MRNWYPLWSDKVLNVAHVSQNQVVKKCELVKDAATVAGKILPIR